MTWPDGYGRFVFPSVGSTLDKAIEVAQREAAPFWLLSHQQTNARGRRGRAWQMPPGNFAATLILRPHGPPAQIALRSFVMSLALHHTFVDLTGRSDVFSLKWPNDVLLNGGKVAGILLESSSSGPSGALLSIGVGVNLAQAPSQALLEDDAVPPASIKEELNVLLRPERFLDVLASHYAHLENTFVAYGFAPVRAGWLTHAARLGEVITARIGASTHEGIFEDVDDAGQLVLRGPHGVQKIAAADIFF